MYYFVSVVDDDYDYCDILQVSACKKMVPFYYYMLGNPFAFFIDDIPQFIEAGPYGVFVLDEAGIR